MDSENVTLIACPHCAAQMPDTAGFCPGCGRSMQTEARAQGKIGVFREPVAGALAYLTFIPAIVFLFFAPYSKNRFVRFHSMQCLFLWGAGILIAIVLKLARLILFIIPVLGPLLVVLLSVLVGLAVVVLWLVLVVKALQVKMLHDSVVGDSAVRWAGSLKRFSARTRKIRDCFASGFLIPCRSVAWQQSRAILSERIFSSMRPEETPSMAFCNMCGSRSLTVRPLAQPALRGFPPPSTVSRPAAGMADNVAGMLAYVTIIPAIIFLVMEPYNKNRFIRFHSCHCLFLFVALIVLQIGLSILCRRALSWPSSHSLFTFVIFDRAVSSGSFC